MNQAIFLATFIISLFVFTSEIKAVEFSISNPKVDGQDITFDAVIADLSASSCPNAKCYLQGAIRMEGKNNYFGFTKNNSGEWIEYVSSTNKNFITEKFLYCEVTADKECKTTVSMRFNNDDPHYYGQGNYEIKLKRYSGESDNSAGEDAGPINISLSVATPEPTASPTPTPSPTPSPSPTATPTKSPTPTPTPTKKPTSTPSPSPSPDQSNSPAPTILGEATTPPKIIGAMGEVESEGELNIPPVALIMMAGGAITVGAAGVSIWKSRYNNTDTPSQ